MRGLLVCIRCLHKDRYTPGDRVDGLPRAEWFETTRRSLCERCYAADLAAGAGGQMAFDDLAAEAELTVQQRFERFHLANPHVFRAMVRFAFEVRSAGRDRLSIWLIANRLRWEAAIQTTGDDYRINNDFLALYSRLIMATEPDLDGMFDIRERRAS